MVTACRESGNVVELGVLPDTPAAVTKLIRRLDGGFLLRLKRTPPRGGADLDQEAPSVA